MLTNFGPLRYWLAAKLMWNPYQDEKALMREFLEGYYGSSADAMAQVIRIMNDEFRKKNNEIPIINGICLLHNNKLITFYTYFLSLLEILFFE